MIIILRTLRPGKRCKILRAYKNISAELMTKKTLISKYRLSRFENGWAKLTEEEERLLAQVLDVSKDELFGPVLATQKESEEDSL